MLKRVLKEGFMIFLTIFFIISIPVMIINNTYIIIIWMLIALLFILFVFVSFWKRIVDGYLRFKSKKVNAEKRESNVNKQVKPEKHEYVNKKRNDKTKLIRYQISFSIIFVGAYIYASILSKSSITSSFYIDILIVICTLILIIIVTVIIDNLFFTDKLIFQNSQLTDEYVSALFLCLFICLFIVVFINDLDINAYYSLFIVLSLNIGLLAYKLMEATHYFKIRRDISYNSISGLFSLLFLIIGLLFIQNMLAYNNLPSSFGNVTLNEYFDIMYYTIINITSVGFGRIYPIKYMAKIVAMEASLFGFIVLYSIIGIFTTERY